MEGQPFADDLFEFLRLLARHEVEYMLVGGYAVALHGFPRNTGDMDVWIRPSERNAGRIEAALRDFGFTPSAADVQALAVPGKVMRMGYPPLRIEILTAPTGVDFQACRLRAVAMEAGGLAIPTISIDDLIVNKRAAGRPKDMIDALELERIRDARNRKPQ